jgi:hypothetical protein
MGRKTKRNDNPDATAQVRIRVHVLNRLRRLAKRDNRSLVDELEVMVRWYEKVPSKDMW